MAVRRHPPVGHCVNCGETGVPFPGDNRLQCRNCGIVWERILPDGGEPSGGAGPTAVSVHPEDCKRMGRIRERGASVEEIAGLFDLPEGVVEYHLSATCGCPDNEQPADGVRGGGR